MNKKECIVYDFDGTLYDGDSFVDFFIFSIKKYPLFIIKILLLPFYVCAWKLKIIDDKALKERFLIFLKNKTLEFRNELVKEFWKKHKIKLFPWINNSLQEDKATKAHLFCISASPEFLLKDVAKELKFDTLIGSIFSDDSKKLNKMKSLNCKGEEKVSRLNAWSKENKVNLIVKKMVSDSFVDMPLFKKAEKCYLVKDKKVEFLEV